MNPILELDTFVSQRVLDLHSAFLEDLFFAVTMMGSLKVIALLAFAFLLLILFKRKTAYLYPFLIATLGSSLVTFVLKLLVQRARPELAMLNETTFSFPSGHATIAIGFYGFMMLILGKKLSSKSQRILTFMVGSLLILGIGFSRIFFNVHYLSDVLAGYAVGMAGLIISIRILRKLQTQKIEISCEK